MHRLLLASTVLVGLAAALPAAATIAMPAGPTQAASASTGNNPLVTKVWWDRHHHWHRHHYNSWHRWRRHTAPLPIVPGAPR